MSGSAVIERLKARAHGLKRDIRALYLAVRSPALPWYAKALAAIVLAYALSPIDLIPDFIPILGYLDDLILVPAGIALCLRLIPPSLMEECRRRAETELEGRSLVSRTGALVIGLIWAGIAYLIIRRIID